MFVMRLGGTLVVTSEQGRDPLPFTAADMIRLELNPGEPRKVVLLGQIFGRRYHCSASFLAVVIGIGCGGLLGSIVLALAMAALASRNSPG
jgi:hypothetical protein